MRPAAMATAFGSASQKRLDSVALYSSAFLKLIDNVKTNRGEMNASKPGRLDVSPQQSGLIGGGDSCGSFKCPTVTVKQPAAAEQPLRHL